jgi:hypothetical protein
LISSAQIGIASSAALPFGAGLVDQDNLFGDSWRKPIGQVDHSKLRILPFLRRQVAGRDGGHDGSQRVRKVTGRF